ncbi:MULTISPECIES: hypothetical protein [unclassified Streptomyces]|uniref:hypothetical protein n=1 Tax=unclassified Streptomyces TaxID=2593676 RepID=UPI00093B40CE|nr:hypothetical protein [Streptomyces sp. CB01883]OKJ87266.1 hypothetical protein AMK32_08480 [Streptomyces sp. CB01883]
MPDLIPAAPGWYLREVDEDGEVSLDPVIAWQAGADADGEPTLLPFVDGGPSMPPLLLTAAAFEELSRSVVYRPNHDPAEPA